MKGNNRTTFLTSFVIFSTLLIPVFTAINIVPSNAKAMQEIPLPQSERILTEDLLNPDGAFLNTGDVIFAYQVIATHTVTFNANGGTGMMTPQVADMPMLLNANTFTRIGYSFAGWNTDTNGSGTSFTNGALYDFSADLTLYAQWIDETPPFVNSIIRLSTNPTSAGSVMFLINFSEDVQNVGTDDFSLYAPGITGTSVTEILGYGSYRTVFVNSGTGSGTLRLDVPNTATISDLNGNALFGLPFTTGDAYTLSRTINLGTYWTGEFGFDQGWRVDQHPRFLQDMNGDGKPDVVGFGNAGIIIGINNGSGFDPGTYWAGEFGYAQGWRVDQHPRFLQDMNGDSRPDAVGFGNAGIIVGINNGSGFDPGTYWTGEFSYAQGWRVDQHPRLLHDMNGDGMPDAVGFANAGVLVGINNGSGFNPGTYWTYWEGEFCYPQGWRVDMHPRFLQDMNEDDKPDVVGFSDAGILVGINNGSGIIFGTYWIGEFGYVQGWRLDQHPRFLQDMDDDGRPDAVGFANGGILVGISRSSHNGPFTAGFDTGTYWTGEFGYAQGWRVDQHPRFLQDMNGDGKPDAVGFANDGIIVGITK